MEKYLRCESAQGTALCIRVEHQNLKQRIGVRVFLEASEEGANMLMVQCDCSPLSALAWLFSPMAWNKGYGTQASLHPSFSLPSSDPLLSLVDPWLYSKALLPCLFPL